MNRFLHGRSLYRLDLSKFIEGEWREGWEEVEGIDVKNIRGLDSCGNKLLIIYDSGHPELYDPEAQERIVLKNDAHSLFDECLRKSCFEVKDKFYFMGKYYKQDNEVQVFKEYNMESQVWEDLPNLSRDLTTAYSTSWNTYWSRRRSRRMDFRVCKDISHIFDNRWILFHTQYRDPMKWYFWIFDTLTKQWNKSKEFVNPYPYNLWIRDKFICCEGYNADEGHTWRTMVYDISDFIPNWIFIGHLVLLRHLVDTGRASCIQNPKNKTDIVLQNLMMDVNLDMFRTVLSYLFPETVKQE